MSFPWNSVRDGLMPLPIPTGLVNNVGQTLLGVVRSLEKSSEDDSNSRVQEVSGILENLIAIYGRQGLFRGDVAKAEHVAASTRQSSSSGGRRSRKGAKKDSGLEFISDTNKRSGESGTTVQDEQLVLTALQRLLSCYDRESKKTHDLHLIDNAAKVLHVICERIKYRPQDECATLESELILASGKTMLSGLSKIMETLVNFAGNGSKNANDDSVDQDRVHLSVGTKSDRVASFKSLSSCLQASASLFSLFGTRLSRSSSIRAQIRRTSLMALNVPDPVVQQSAATLLASLPLVGTVQSLSPAEGWTSALTESVAAVFVVLGMIVPRTTKTNNHDTYITEDYKKIISAWENSVRRDVKMGQKTEAVSIFVNGLVTYLLALSKRNGYGDGAQSLLLSAHVPVQYMLELCDYMLSFPQAAESTYYGTKKRLRSEAIQGGLLSPNEVAFDVALHIKSLGHSVLDTFVSGVGGPVVVRHGRTMMRIVYSSLQQSCSASIRIAMDPSVANLYEGKRRKWLHTSIPMRIQAIKSFRVLVALLGSNAMAPSRSPKGANGNHLRDNSSKCVQIIAGSLLEKLSSDLEGTGVDDHWGTLEESVHLVSEAACALMTTLVVCGGYMGQESRALIDSVASTCLNELTEESSSQAGMWSTVRTAILDLGAKCVCTPWPDGATSSLATIVREAANVCINDRNAGVTTAARSAQSICDALDIPRSLPLTVVSRRSVDEKDISNPGPASSFSEGIRVAKRKADKQPNAIQQDSMAKNEADRNKRKKVESTNLEDNSRVEADRKRTAQDKTLTVRATEESDQKKIALERSVSSADSVKEELTVEKDNREGITTTRNTSESATESPSRKQQVNDTVSTENQLEQTDGSLRDGKIETMASKPPESEDDSDVPEIFDCGPDEADTL